MLGPGSLRLALHGGSVSMGVMWIMGDPLMGGLDRLVHATSVFTLSVLTEICSRPALLARIAMKSDCVFSLSMMVRSLDRGGNNIWTYTADAWD